MGDNLYTTKLSTIVKTAAIYYAFQGMESKKFFGFFMHDNQIKIVKGQAITSISSCGENVHPSWNCKQVWPLSSFKVSKVRSVKENLNQALNFSLLMTSSTALAK